MPRIPLRWDDNLSASERIIDDWLAPQLPPRSKGRPRLVTRSMVISYALQTWATQIANGARLTTEELQEAITTYYEARLNRAVTGESRKSTNTTVSAEALKNAEMIFAYLLAEKERLGFPGIIPQSRLSTNRDMAIYLAMMRRAKEIEPDFEISIAPVTPKEPEPENMD